MADQISPLRLAYAASQAFSPGGGVSVSYTHVIAKVDNLGYAKQVVLHARVGDQWQQYPLSWMEWRGDHDLFATQYPLRVPAVSEFALSYTVDGRTYWDSQFGLNYHVGTLNTVAGGNVALARATTRLIGQFSDRVVTGEIFVNNTSPRKKVGMRFSTDGSSTWHETAANYAGWATEAAYSNGGIVESWSFQTPVFSSGPQALLLAVYYLDLNSGKTFWDNNFGHDYALSTIPNADIR